MNLCRQASCISNPKPVSAIPSLHHPVQFSSSVFTFPSTFSPSTFFSLPRQRLFQPSTPPPPQEKLDSAFRASNKLVDIPSFFASKVFGFFISLKMWLPPLLVLVLMMLCVHQNTASSANDANGLSEWLDAHSVSTENATGSIISNNTALSAASIRSQQSRCPASCDASGLNPSNWTVYHSLDRISACNRSMLLDFNLFNPLEDPSTQITVRTCAGTPTDAEYTSSKACISSGSRIEVQEYIQISFNQTIRVGSLQNFTTASQQLKHYLAQQELSCNPNIAFAYSGSIALGLYAGVGMQNTTANILEQFVAKVQTVGISESVLIQLCASPAQNRSSRYSLGIVASGNGDIAFVQNAVRTWASGECITTLDNSSSWQRVNLSIPVPPSNSTMFSTNTTLMRNTKSAAGRVLAPRETVTCKTIQVAAGDSCKLPTASFFEPLFTSLSQIIRIFANFVSSSSMQVGLWLVSAKSLLLSSQYTIRVQHCKLTTPSPHKYCAETNVILLLVVQV